MHEEGAVLLSVEVSAEGRVTGVSIVKSSGFSLLDQAAVSAVRRWTFVPATALGVPISSHPTVPIRFRLPTQ
jgi:protein TonB